ncbi:hypothetical protein EYR41_009810 [Orbilia oligospora]|uniref:Uncharacterized protein n=1 Tax=Orbilia oligospora TaxID=2813651 RepID=A0A8H2DVZ0_ORBOL|nr:hypothetical protein TWF217_004220 [Orbilia oligospora]KAF3257918.1 hypothetical protein TWF128_004830 [Orbilia oligospora]KAF3289237.1 hypothetical protein TWF132_007677 [Orbilia oligospora]TGJ65873.1 hypothetical protein EYR41_009810 [Orbilia oligospora]
MFTSVENITTIFKFRVPRSIQNNLYVAIWRAISSFPKFKNIKIIRLSSSRVREFRDPPRDPYKIFSLKLSPEAKEFLGPVGISDEELGNGISIAKQNFKTVKLESRHLELQRQPGFCSRPFFFGNSAETLKSMNLCISGLLSIAGPDHSPITIRFSNVTKIKLNVLEIPWPRHPFEEIAPTIKRFNQNELSKFIRDLMNAGLESLENVTFIRMPIWAGFWNELIFRECRIDRSDKERGPRIWWKRSYRYHDTNIRNLTPDQTEFDEGDANDSGDDLDETPPKGAELCRF